MGGVEVDFFFYIENLSVELALVLSLCPCLFLLFKVGPVVCETYLQTHSVHTHECTHACKHAHARVHTHTHTHTDGKKSPNEKNKNICVGEWGWGVEGSRLEAWMKSHKSKVAITFICTPANQETVSVLEKTQANKTFRT